MKRVFSLIALVVFGSVSIFAQAQPAASEPIISFGNTAWMIVATAMVLLMTIPGLAFFYGGLVRQKNILNILMQCFAIMAAVTLQWVVFGYSLVFSGDGSFIGNFDWAMLKGIRITDVSPFFISQEHDRIPHILYVMYQGMFAVITPALIAGAFAERIKFSGFLLFSILWATFVYDPVAHWIWNPAGWLAKMGAIDFAGGTVVHINAGIASLVAALYIGKRHNYVNMTLPPHNIPFVALGAGLLWFGWFGFNAGSGLAADGLAANAFLTTHVSAATAAFVWMGLDWILNKKPTTVGISTGAVAGLAGITQAAGFVSVGSAIIIGAISSVVCFWMVGVAKVKWNYDDTLDAFGVHGVAGFIGAIATGIFATALVQPNYSGLIEGNTALVGVQTLMAVVVAVYAGLVSWLLFWITDKLVGVRASKKEESVGLDFAMHKEIAYTNVD